MPLDLNQLTEAERDAILSVIKRDEDLKQKDGDRVRQVPSEIKQLRLKGVLKDGQDSETTCARCREKFGFFSNKGAICPNCSHKVCDKCQVRDTEKHSFLCILCSKQKSVPLLLY
ncbi:hypothetical protein CAPTEDRAFT_145934 [Capitella teleta]|uniref:RabBD domain-containing protein n=1 Tax=Capitella teleta TaxID=283909 RepID=X1Z4E7_CAPTE|nr:hypothetical protein CAPTEDRAFT_145934 [Capitella teleta]|eukprot:ELU00292.1 hypothetical protein CAPTEDRAFT_145934 [Capitella teleta]